MSIILLIFYIVRSIHPSILLHPLNLNFLTKVRSLKMLTNNNKSKNIDYILENH